MRYTDTRDDEKERGITIKSTAISMYFDIDKEELSAIKQKTDGESMVPHGLRKSWLTERFSTRYRVLD